MFVHSMRGNFLDCHSQANRSFHRLQIPNFKRISSFFFILMLFSFLSQSFSATSSKNFTLGIKPSFHLYYPLMPIPLVMTATPSNASPTVFTNSVKNLQFYKYFIFGRVSTIKNSFELGFSYAPNILSGIYWSENISGKTFYSQGVSIDQLDFSFTWNRHTGPFFFSLGINAFLFTVQPDSTDIEGTKFLMPISGIPRSLFYIAPSVGFGITVFNLKNTSLELQAKMIGNTGIAFRKETLLNSFEVSLSYNFNLIPLADFRVRYEEEFSFRKSVHFGIKTGWSFLLLGETASLPLTVGLRTPEGLSKTNALLVRSWIYQGYDVGFHMQKDKGSLSWSTGIIFTLPLGLSERSEDAETIVLTKGQNWWSQTNYLFSVAAVPRYLAYTWNWNLRAYFKEYFLGCGGNLQIVTGSMDYTVTEGADLVQKLDSGNKQILMDVSLPLEINAGMTLFKSRVFQWDSCVSLMLAYSLYTSKWSSGVRVQSGLMF